MQRYAELRVGRKQFRVHLIEALRRIERSTRRGIVGDVLIVDGLVTHMRPGGFLHGLPVPKGFQSPLEQELRLVFLARYRADNVLIEPGGQAVGFDVGDEPMAILLTDE